MAGISNSIDGEMLKVVLYVEPRSKSSIPFPWRIYCSYEHSVAMWIMKHFQEKYTCFKVGSCEVLSDNVIARMFLNDARNDPCVTRTRSKFFQEHIMERYNINARND